MKIPSIIITLIIAVLLLGNTESMEASIDKEIIRVMDVTGDGKLETISLHLTAKSLHTPFSWTLTISSTGEKLLTHSSDDTRIDKFFHDEDYVMGCTGYLACKRKYYFHDILDGLVVPRTGYNLEGILDKSRGNTLYHVGKAYLEKCCAIRGAEADAILSAIERRLRNGTAIVISVTTSPVTGRPPMVFAPEVDHFVPIYED